MIMKHRKRKRRLIKPEMQTQAIFLSLAFAKIAVGLTCLAIYYAMREDLAAHPEVLDGLPRVLGAASLVALGVMTPLLFGYVTYATHRVAGPAYRMEQYLKAYLRGEQQGRLTLREKDELQVLAQLLDMALAGPKARDGAPGPEQAAPDSSDARDEPAIEADQVEAPLPREKGGPSRTEGHAA